MKGMTATWKKNYLVCKLHIEQKYMDIAIIIFHWPLLGETEREYQSKCAQVLVDQAPSTNVDHEEVISHQETATNESIVEINDNEDLKQGN